MNIDKTMKSLVLSGLVLALTVACASLAGAPAPTLEPGSISVTEMPAEAATEAPQQQRLRSRRRLRRLCPNRGNGW